jgi:hypothetical protein
MDWAINIAEYAQPLIYTMSMKMTATLSDFDRTTRLTAMFFALIQIVIFA